MGHAFLFDHCAANSSVSMSGGREPTSRHSAKQDRISRAATKWLHAATKEAMHPGHAEGFGAGWIALL